MSLTNNHKKLFLTYFAFMLFITIILVIYNPSPFFTRDIWAEDGSHYLGNTIR